MRRTVAIEARNCRVQKNITSAAQLPMNSFSIYIGEIFLREFEMAKEKNANSQTNSHFRV